MATAAIDLHTKTEVLLESLPYIQQFKGAVFVVKFGGSFMDTDTARVSVATDLVYLASVGIHVVVVHGGGPAINRAMNEAALQPVFRNGLRVTDEATVAIVEQTLNGTINGDICANLTRRGGQAAGIPGQKVFHAVKLEQDEDGQPVDLGFVGNVASVNTSPVQQALAQGRIPVVSPIGVDATGQFYNTNADTAAAALAAALKARRLVYLCDVPGLLRNPADPSSLISSLAVDQVRALKQDGTISSGMAPKVDSAVNAIRNGVRRVHFIDGRLPHSILLEIFTDEGVGTEIVSSAKQ
jgi:acetylglutamate kinase